jgi:hypothetical protein
VRDDDIEAERAMQRDTTLWIDGADALFADRLRRRIPSASMKAPRDPLRIQALSRILHYPAYVLGQIDYYRQQDIDLLPVPAAVHDAYEQLLLGRAVGVIRLRDDGRVSRVSTDIILGDSPLAAAQHLAASETLRAELDSEIAPRLSVAGNVERDLHQLLHGTPPLSAFERGVVGGLLKRYGL